MCIKPPGTCSARSSSTVLRQSSFAQCEQFQSAALLRGVISTDGMGSATSRGLCQRLNCIICWFWRQTQHSDLKAQFTPVLPPMSLMCLFSFSKQRQLCCSQFCHSTLVEPLTCLVQVKEKSWLSIPRPFYTSGTWPVCMDTVVQAAFSAPAMQESSSAARHMQCHSGVCFLMLVEGKAGLKICKFVPHSLVTCSNYTFAFYRLFFFLIHCW